MHGAAVWWFLLAAGTASAAQDSLGPASAPVDLSRMDTAAADTSTGASYTDTHGNTVHFPLGERSFADRVVEFRMGGGEPTARQPSAALGPPDYIDADANIVSLGLSGSLVVAFDDNALVDREGPDLYVFEIGAIEPTLLEISTDGRSWIDVGRIEGATAQVDIGPFAEPGAEYRYLRLTDLEHESGYPGADIDAIGAIGSVAAVAPFPWPLLLTLLGLMGLLRAPREETEEQSALSLEGQEYCLAAHEIELRLVPAGTAEAAAEVRLEMEAQDRQHLLGEKGPVPLAERIIAFRAAELAEYVTVRATASGGPDGTQEEATHEVTVWSLRAWDEPGRRIGPRPMHLRQIWAEFAFRLGPADLSLGDVLEGGTLRLRSLEEDGEERLDLRLELRVDGESVVLADERMAEHFAFEERGIRWSGRLPEPASGDGRDAAVEDDGAAPVHRTRPGPHRLELTVRNGTHEARASWDFELDTVNTVLDLTGYWRAEAGELSGWLMAGESHGGGRVSLHTAPGVTLTGQWRDAEHILAAEVDLLPGGTPSSGEMDDVIAPPTVLRGLQQARMDLPMLRGVASGAGGGRLALRKERWRLVVVDDRSTYWFAPEGGRAPGATYRGIVGGDHAVLRYRRSQEPRSRIEPRFLAARVRVRDAQRRVVAEALFRGADPPSERGPLTVEFERGEVRWTGRRPDGTAAPAGVYHLELTLRDGMAEQSLEHKVLLGSGMRIVRAPERFAAAVEDVPIVCEWVPPEGAPDRLTLSVHARDGSRLHERELPTRGSGDRLTVEWHRTDHTLLDWPRQTPFRLELRGRDRLANEEHSDSIEIGVEPARIGIEIEPPPERGPQSRAYYREREIPADTDPLPVRARLWLRASSGAEVPAGSGVRLVITERVRSVWEDHAGVRAHGLVEPGRSPATELELETIDGWIEARYRPPTHAAAAGTELGDVVEADRFRLTAALAGWRGRPVEESTDWYDIAPGRPARLRQVYLAGVAAEEADVNLSLDHFHSGFHPIQTFTRTLASQASGLFTNLPPLRAALERGLSSYAELRLRYVGPVRHVPVRGAETQRVAAAVLEVYLAGCAGDDHSRLLGGQALLVLMRLSDRLGNPVPLTMHEDGRGNVREPMARVQCEFADHGGSSPSFIVMAANGAYSTRGRTIASALGPATVTTPLGLMAFYYVPAYPFPEIERGELPQGVEKYLEAHELTTLRARLTTERDDRISLWVDFDGATLRPTEPLRLVAPGTLVLEQSEAMKWLRWAIAGDVTDVDTFKAEVGFSVIPVLGDGRDIGVYTLKNLLASEVSPWDHFFAALAVVGLALDALDLTIVGIVPNAAVATLKATGKFVRSTFGATSRIASALLEVFQPLVRAARNASPGNLRPVVDEALKADSFILLLARAAQRGEFDARLRQIGNFVNTCNPTRCLLCFFTWSADLSEYFLKRHSGELTELAALLRRTDVDSLDAAARAQDAKRLFEKVGQLSRKLGFADAAATASAPAFRNLLAVLAHAPQPEKLLDELLSLDSDVLRAAATRIFANDGFLRAARHARSPVLPVLAKQLREHGADAVEVVARATTPEPRSFHNLVQLIQELDALPTSARRLPDLVPFLREITRAPHYTELAGRHGLAHVVELAAGLAEAGRKGAAERTIRLLEDLTTQGPRPKILFEHLPDAFEALGPQRYDLYLESIDFFRRGGTGPLIDGIVRPATARGTANLLTVATGGRNAAAFALEIVGTRSLIENGQIVVSAQSRFDVPVPSSLRFGADDVQGFGIKATQSGRAAEGTLRTLEGDVVVLIGGQRYYVDWKLYPPDALPSPATLRRAGTALLNRQGPVEGLVEGVVVLGARSWPREAQRAFEQADLPLGRRLLLGYADAPPGSPLAQFLEGLY